MDPNFQQWQINITNNTIVIINTNNQIMASKRANTSPLKSTFQYTIYIKDGHAYIWVEPGYNMPSFIELDIVDPSLLQMNTPQPNKTYGNVPGRSGRKVEPHRCVFVI